MSQPRNPIPAFILQFQSKCNRAESDSRLQVRPLVIAAALAVAAAAGTVAAAEPTAWVRGRILVQPKPGLPDSEFYKILGQHGGVSVGRIPQLNVHIVELPAQASENAVAAQLAHNPHLKFAEVDAAVPLAATPNDTYFPNEWHITKTGVANAWDYTLGTGVTIAILDSGVDSSHPDLASKIVPGYNFYDNNTNTADVYGHGTKSAGTAAAITNNAAGVSGIAWDSRIMPIRVTGTDGWATWSGLASGTTWAVDHGARVVSMSFQNPSSSSTVLNAANYARGKGAVVVGAAGNTGALDSTAASSLMTIVGATDGNDARASWSTYGPSVDISAPGVGVYTTTNGGGYATWSGTSAATPAVAGVTALVIAANPRLTPAQIESILYSTSVDLGDPGYDQFYGNGRVNALAAVQAALATSTSDTQAPAVSIAAPTGGTVAGLVTVSVNSSDNLGVSKVDLYVAGTLLASDVTAPYSFSWDTRSLPDGATTLVAKAADAAGNVGTSGAVSVVVANGPAAVVTTDTTAPSVSFSSPSSGSTLPKKGNVSVMVRASDNVAVSSLKLSIDGAVVASTNQPSISYNWNVNKTAAGTHTLTATASDAAGNTRTETIQVTK